MIYADTDFFIALIKESDWLSEKAEKLLAKHKGEIWTSHWTLIELLLLAKEYGLDPEITIVSVLELTHVKGEINTVLFAAHLMKENNMNTFDALHAASCGDSKIISSDKIFDRIGLERIKLEE